MEKETMLMLALAVLMLVGGVVGAWHERPRSRPTGPVAGEPDPLDGFSDREIQRVALDFVHVERTSPSWCGGTLAQYDCADERIQAARAKYADYEPARMRRAIMDWLDYYQRANDENRRDVQRYRDLRGRLPPETAP